MRWNPEPEDVQKSVAQLVLTIVEFLRRLMERQAIRRMEQKTLTKKEVEAVGAALMTLEQTVREIGAQVRPHARGSQPRSRPARQADVISGTAARTEKYVSSAAVDRPSDARDRDGRADHQLLLAEIPAAPKAGRHRHRLVER